MMPQASDGAAPPDPFPGEYRLLRCLGQGSYGRVWLAEDLKLHCLVALKTVRGHAAAWQALEKDARSLAGIRHPHVVQVHCWREALGQPWLILQYVEGQSLAELLQQRGALPWQQAVRYVADVAEGLRAVHRAGVLHRDIKPGNILLDRRDGQDEALLADFGVAGRIGLAQTIAGTPAYMPPELFDGAAGETSDVYSLAATLFESVTGVVPHLGESFDALRRLAREGLPHPDPRLAVAPESVERAIRLGMAAAPNARPNANEFLALLRTALNQSLIDALPLTAPAPHGAELQLKVYRRVDGNDVPVAAGGAASNYLARDLRRVPPPPRTVQLRTGDRVRIEVQARGQGYLVVLNVGPTGNLNLLYPTVWPPTPADGLIEAEQPVRIVEVELTPPPGRERICALWSATPWDLPIERLPCLIDTVQTNLSEAYYATRDLQRVEACLRRRTPTSWLTTTVELDHRPADAAVHDRFPTRRTMPPAT